MNIHERFDNFKAMPHKSQLDNWEELAGLTENFISSKNQDLKLAADIAEQIDYHRSLMGSSKAYESATKIDVKLCNLGLSIARIAYGNSRQLLKFLEAAHYYSSHYKEYFDQNKIEQEIKQINIKG